MIANYHTHTWRCRHAAGSEREYIERAIENGIKILGFSDHTPYPFPRGYDSGMRMDMEQLEDYVVQILDLKWEYQRDIEIHLGLETEYYPLFWERLMKFLDGYPIEYLLLGQHHLDSEIQNAYWSGERTEDGALLKKYVDQCIEAMKTGKFVYFAHPDLFNFRGERSVFDREYRRLCRYAKKCGIPLEINFLGLDEQRNYPFAPFWKIAGEEENTVIFGCDAHHPEKIWNPRAEKLAKKLVDQYHLNLIETIPLNTHN